MPKSSHGPLMTKRRCPDSARWKLTDTNSDGLLDYSEFAQRIVEVAQTESTTLDGAATSRVVSSWSLVSKEEQTDGDLPFSYGL